MLRDGQRLDHSVRVGHRGRGRPQRLVDRALLGCVDADDGRSDLAEHSLHGLLDALSAVACATVAQFDGFVLTGRSAGRHRSPGETSVFEQNLDLIVSLAQRGFVIDKGRIIAEVPPEDIRDREKVKKWLAL